MRDLARLEPVRLYAIASALVALATEYADLPSAAILALVAAVLGVGEAVRRDVTPSARMPEPPRPGVGE